MNFEMPLTISDDHLCPTSTALGLAIVLEDRLECHIDFKEPEEEPPVIIYDERIRLFEI